MDIKALEMPFREGDRVRIRKGTRYSKFSSPINPQNTTGTVFEIWNYKYICVKWDNLYKNLYVKHDLVRVHGLLWSHDEAKVQP